MLSGILIEINTRIITYLYLQLIIHDPTRCPSLFCYSVNDALVSYKIVEEVVRKRSKLLQNVSAKKWESSKHVRHIYDFEADYISEMQSFSRNIGILPPT